MPPRARPPSATPLALRRPPSRLAPGPEGSRPFSFPRLVQPVLEARWHRLPRRNDPKRGSRTAWFPDWMRRFLEHRVKGWMNTTTRYSAAYLSLAQRYGFDFIRRRE